MKLKEALQYLVEGKILIRQPAQTWTKMKLVDDQFYYSHPVDGGGWHIIVDLNGWFAINDWMLYTEPTKSAIEEVIDCIEKDDNAPVYLKVINVQARAECEAMVKKQRELEQVVDETIVNLLEYATVSTEVSKIILCLKNAREEQK